MQRFCMVYRFWVYYRVSSKIMLRFMIIINLLLTHKSELVLNETLYLCTWILYLFPYGFQGVVTFHLYKATCTEHISDVHMQRTMVAFLLVWLDPLVIDQFYYIDWKQKEFLPSLKIWLQNSAVDPYSVLRDCLYQSRR